MKSKYEFKVMTEMLWAISETIWRQVMKFNPFSFPWVLRFKTKVIYRMDSRQGFNDINSF